MAIIDEPGLLEGADGDGDAGASHPKHHRKKFVAQRQIVACHAIVRRQQPARQPFRQGVPPVARGCLCDLNVEGPDVAEQQTQKARRHPPVMAAALPGAAWYTSATGYALTIYRLAATTGGLVATQRPNGTI